VFFLTSSMDENVIHLANYALYIFKDFRQVSNKIIRFQTKFLIRLKKKISVKIILLSISVV